MNCVDVCPKGLSPAKAIAKIKEMQLRGGGKRLSAAPAAAGKTIRLLKVK